MKLPDFTVESTAGTLNLGDLGAFVLFFYPRDNTPGCTTEAKDFSALKSEFESLGYKVLGASRDSMASHHKFIEKQELSVDLISDPEETLCGHFDVIKEKNMYGKKVLGIERSTFAFNAKGELVFEQRKVKAKEHAEKVLDALKALA